MTPRRKFLLSTYTCYGNVGRIRFTFLFVPFPHSYPYQRSIDPFEAASIVVLVAPKSTIAKPFSYIFLRQTNCLRFICIPNGEPRNGKQGETLRFRSAQYPSDRFEIVKGLVAIAVEGRSPNTRQPYNLIQSPWFIFFSVLFALLTSWTQREECTHWSGSKSWSDPIAIAWQ